MSEQPVQSNLQSGRASEGVAFRAEHVAEWKSEVTACLNECLDEVQAIGVLLNSLDSHEGGGSASSSAQGIAPPTLAATPDFSHPAAIPDSYEPPSPAVTPTLAAPPTPVTPPASAPTPAPEVNSPARPLALEPLASPNEPETAPLPKDDDDDHDARLAKLKRLLAERLND